jgi:2-hydroxy-3-oxopropionate reductase
MANIGFIGLGIMGAPMAGHLIADGHTLFTNTVGPTPSALVEAGARVCLNGAEVASQADIIFIMVPDTPQVDEVLFGNDGVASALSAGKIVVDMSSISPVPGSLRPGLSATWMCAMRARCFSTVFASSPSERWAW